MLTVLIAWTALSLPAGIVVGKFIAAHHSGAPHGVTPSPGVSIPRAPGVLSHDHHEMTSTSQVQQDHA